MDNVVQMKLKPLLIALITASMILTAYLYHISTQPIVLKISTTTSLYDTGLLDLLAEKFRERNPGVAVQFLAVGSGEALRLASMGDVDMVLVHAPSLERRYLDDGVLGEGRIFAYNYFVLVGPKGDPAGAEELDVKEAFRAIFRAGDEGRAIFVSRGDSSGTHLRELSIWRAAGLDPHGKPWYIETGSGMAETLMVAAEKGGYTLSDIGTYLRFRDRLSNLKIIVGESRELLNIYSVYIVRGTLNTDIAARFMGFLVSDEGQRLIGSYGVEDYGQPLFHPAKGGEWLKGEWLRMAGGS